MKEIIISLKLRTNNIKTILFGIVMIVWYIYFCWGGVTLGETFRSKCKYQENTQKYLVKKNE